VRHPIYQKGIQQLTSYGVCSNTLRNMVIIVEY
jgi:hypothetical protein